MAPVRRASSALLPPGARAGSAKDAPSLGRWVGGDSVLMEIRVLSGAGFCVGPVLCLQATAHGVCLLHYRALAVRGCSCSPNSLSWLAVFAHAEVGMPWVFRHA